MFVTALDLALEMSTNKQKPSEESLAALREAAQREGVSIMQPISLQELAAQTVKERLNKRMNKGKPKACDCGTETERAGQIRYCPACGANYFEVN